VTSEAVEKSESEAESWVPVEIVAIEKLSSSVRSLGIWISVVLIEAMVDFGDFEMEKFFKRSMSPWKSIVLVVEACVLFGVAIEAVSTTVRSLRF